MLYSIAFSSSIKQSATQSIIL